MIKKNYDTGQTSTLFFKGKQHLLTSLKVLLKQNKKDSLPIILQLFEGELEEGLKIQSAGIFLDFNGYREFMTVHPVFDQLLFLQIKKKNEFEIWKSELSSNPNIIPVVSELRTDWFRNIFIEQLPVMFEISSLIEFPDFIPGYIIKKSEPKDEKGLLEIRQSLHANYSQILALLSERRNLIQELNIIKKEQKIEVFQKDVYLKNIINCYLDSNQHNLPLGDCIDLYMLLHTMSVKQQEE